MFPRTGIHIGIDVNSLVTGGWRLDFNAPVAKFGGYVGRTCIWFSDIQVDVYDETNTLVASFPFSATAGGSGSWNWFGVEATGGTLISAVVLQGIGSPTSSHGLTIDDLQLTTAPPVAADHTTWGQIKNIYR